MYHISKIEKVPRGIISDYVVYYYLDMYSIACLITRHLVFFHYGLEPISCCFSEKTINGYDKL